MPTAEDFRAELMALFARAAKQGRPHIEINAGELHRSVGGYPGGSHRMPICCGVMRDEFKRGDAEVIYDTESGQGAALTIRYSLPRKTWFA
jgi:5-methylcytosine-specific restriction protein A